MAERRRRDELQHQQTRIMVPHWSSSLTSAMKKGKRRSKKFYKVRTFEDTNRLQQGTLGQQNSKDDAWHETRRYRLTASNFGVECKRAESTLCNKLMKQITVLCILQTKAVLYRQCHEDSAKKMYEEHYKIKIESRGIFVSYWLPWTGASPGVLVGEDGLVEENVFLL
ncbi:hypothetical protein PR048_013113 [Dryococelus australis]|uniref:Uncharacterized protein n=1 Tax=Dryococelus australis TaxID=614101 RepID=A0ABQ9HRE9_9NEOP|nr:hypothetical protein PR048_013113 [Dryococelus australis]